MCEQASLPLVLTKIFINDVPELVLKVSEILKDLIDNAQKEKQERIN